MKLDAARLCLDCEEIHEEQVCPLCSSEAFAYLTRWVQPGAASVSSVRERATRPPVASQQHRTPEQIEAYRQLLEGKPPSRRGGLVAKSVLGLAAFGLAGWAWRAAGRARQGDGAKRIEEAGAQGPGATLEEAGAHGPGPT